MLLVTAEKVYIFAKEIIYIFKEGLLLPPMIDKILDLSEYRGRFRKWLLDELIIRYPRRLNSLRFRDM